MTAQPTIDVEHTEQVEERQTTALTTQPSGGGLLATSQYNAIRAISQEVSKSRMYGRKSEAEAFCIITTGVEMGLSPFQALRSIHIIDGRPSPSADLMVALARRNPACEYFEAVEVSNTSATYRTKRRGRPEQIRTFTIEDANRAGLTKKDNWRNYPADMLRARVSSKLARQVYPESTGGLYIPEELEHVGDVEIVSGDFGSEPVDATFEERQLGEGEAKKQVLAAVEKKLGLVGQPATDRARKLWRESGLKAPVAESALDAVIAQIEVPEQADDDEPANDPHDVLPLSDDERKRVYRRIFALLGETGRKDIEEARHCYLHAHFEVDSLNDLTDQQVEALASNLGGKSLEEREAWVAEWAEVARQAAKETAE